MIGLLSLIANSIDRRAVRWQNPFAAVPGSSTTGGWDGSVVSAPARLLSTSASFKNLQLNEADYADYGSDASHIFVGLPAGARDDCIGVAVDTRVSAIRPGANWQPAEFLQELYSVRRGLRRRRCRPEGARGRNRLRHRKNQHSRYCAGRRYGCALSGSA